MVPNNISGATITINETISTSEQQGIIINSNPASSKQIVAWFTVETPINGDNTLFWIDVETKNAALETIPVSLTVDELYDSKIIELSQYYPVKNAELTVTSKKENIETAKHEKENESSTAPDNQFAGEKTAAEQTSSIDASQTIRDNVSWETVSALVDESENAKPEVLTDRPSPIVDTETPTVDQAAPAALPKSPCPIFGVIAAFGVFSLTACCRRK